MVAAFPRLQLREKGGCELVSANTYIHTYGSTTVVLHEHDMPLQSSRSKLYFTRYAKGEARGCPPACLAHQRGGGQRLRLLWSVRRPASR